jgi:hypothetical protein
MLKQRGKSSMEKFKLTKESQPITKDTLLKYWRKPKIINGKLFANAYQRENLLLLLIYNIGVDRTLQLISENFPNQIRIESSLEQDQEIETVLTDLTKRIETIESWIENHSRNDVQTDYMNKNSFTEEKEGEDHNYNDFKLWSYVLKKIQPKISKPSYETWFKSTSAKLLDDDVLIVYGNNEFQTDWLQERYKELIFFTVKEVSGQTYEIEFSVRSDRSRSGSI